MWPHTPKNEELDDEIRGHLAISIRQRIERGEDPESARLEAMKEFGNLTLTRDSIRSVWRWGWLDRLGLAAQDVKFAVRSLLRAKALAITVVVTLALGIGANAAIFSVVRTVLLRPLVNRDEDRLIYIRQSAPGIGAENMTFSMPEVHDFEARVKSVSAFGDFSTVDLTLIGLSDEPRVLRAGVVSGSYFDVMGLRPVLGRLLNAKDDGPDAAPVAVLTYHFWVNAMHSDPNVAGKTVRLGVRPATIVGVLEPSIPYPTDTEIIANVVTSPHHLGATMVTNRTHRMTELFARLAPGATLEAARAEMKATYAAIVREHPDAYPASGDFQIRVGKLRDEIAAPARTILLALLSAAAMVFLIACSNVANLILARSVRREGELSIRAALGAGPMALRRTLLAESLVLCGAGAALGLALSGPFVAIVAKYAARFSVRAIGATVDPSVLWVGAGMAIAAAIGLAYVPRLPSIGAPNSVSASHAGVRITPGTNRRLRVFAVAQIAFSFVLLAAAGMVLRTLIGLQTGNTGYEMAHVLAFDIPTPAVGVGMGDPKLLKVYADITQRVGQLPGVQGVATGMIVPWRDAGKMGPGMRFGAEGYTPATGEENPRARFRVVSPDFFNTVGIRFLAGRDFTENDRAGSEPVAIVSESVARQLFANGDALNHHVWWGDERAEGRRIVGVVADADDESIPGRPTMAIYQPVQQVGIGGRLFVRAAGDPHGLIAAITRTIRGISADQAVERAATLEEIRDEVISPDRLNAFVISGFAGIALLIAVVGVSGVLAFSVSARTRELGVRLAVGCTPGRLLRGVLSEGAVIAAVGCAAGAAGGVVIARAASKLFALVQAPGALPGTAAAVLLILAAGVASLIPAMRAARTDVLKALRSD